MPEEQHVFALPKEKRYCMTDIPHALNSLRKVRDRPERLEVEAAIYARFPELVGVPVDTDTQGWGLDKALPKEKKPDNVEKG